ncbi:MAG: Hippocampus abundant transcript 1 protein [Geoglossum simile]|nr:MAG: Hippocampus abundant transcript 1 protein [Geoglossum simile]
MATDSSYTYQRVHGEAGELSDDDEGVGRRAAEDKQRGFEALVWFRRPSVFFLLPVFLLFNLAMGATSMPRTNVLISLICRKILFSAPLGPSGSTEQQLSARHGVGHSMGMNTTSGNYSSIVIGDHNPQCSINTVESATAMLTLWGNLIAGILGAIASPFWGRLSDRYGRVKPLAAASTVILSSEVVVVLIATLPDVISLNWVYLAFILEGFSGSFILIMALASSYAADCTRDSERNVALGWFHGSMFFGMAAGPAFGGYLGMSGGESRPLLIFYTALAMRVVGILFLLFVVPESLPLSLQSQPHPHSPSIRARIFSNPSQKAWTEKAKSANPLRILRIFMPTAERSRRDRGKQWNLIALASVNTIMFGAVMGAMNVMMLYSEFIFGWGNKESGTFLSIINIFRTLATVLILPLAISLSRRFFHQTSTHGFNTLDLLLLRLSILSDLIGYIGYALAPTGALFTVSGAVASLGAIGLATSEASMTKLVGSAKTGELLGALGFLQAMARIVAPTVANLTYSWTVDKAPQVVFWGIAVCFGGAGVVTFLIRPDEAGGAGESEEDEDAVPLQAQKDCC